MNSEKPVVLQNVTADLVSDSVLALPVPGTALLRYLDEIGVAYTLYHHEPVFTVAESDHLKEIIPGLHCRNLFLRDKKKVMYLVVAGNDTKVDLRGLQTILKSDRFSFGSADRLWEYLGVRPGSVCPFAIMNDKKNDVQIILDAAMMREDLVCYHPMENHMSVTLTPQDLLKFIASTGHEPIIIDLDDVAQKESA